MHVLKNKKVGLGLVVTSLLLMVGTTFAASQVEYVLQLGGDNHAASIKAGTYVLYTPGSSADGQTFPIGTQITWDAVLKASGTQTSGPGAGSAIKGAANFVFDLELRQGSAAGPIVDLPVFASSIHDGGSECIPSGGTIPEGLCPPCLAGASFAFSYNVWGIYGYGRVVDPPWRGGVVSCPGYPNLPAGGGPNMNVCLYPTIENGKLLGMGAGYQRWLYGSGSTPTWSVFGVGLASGGLGQVPVVEGQINTDDLAPGTYFLKLIPKSGTNVLRGDISLTANQNAFATTAENLVGSTRWFIIEGCDGPEDCDDGDLCTDDACVNSICANTPVDCGDDICDPGTGECVECLNNSHCDDGLFCNGTEICSAGVCGAGTDPCPGQSCDEENNECVPVSNPPTLSSASLAMEHGTPGIGPWYAVDLPIGSANTKTESRQNVNTPYWIITLTFSEAMEAIDGDVELGDEVVLSQALDASAYFVSENELEIFLLTIPANQTCLSITVTGLRSVATGQELAGDNDVHVATLYGDVTRNKAVNILDSNLVKSNLAKPVTSGNCHVDVDCSNSINILDQNKVKANLAKSVACP